MGFLNQAIRGIKQSIRNFKKRFSGSRKKRRSRKTEPTEIPQKWSSPAARKKNQQFIIKHKKRIPGFLMFKRLLAALLFFINFILSQFLLGSIGEQAQGIFILFLANSFILADYLWKTRRKPE